MNKLCYLSEGADIGSLIFGVIITFIICIVIFLIIRSILLWYWKVDVILKNQEQQTALLKQIFEQEDRVDARVNYYKFRALGDNTKAHEFLLYMIMHDLNFPVLKKKKER